jgi:putative addiction module component (TIGR02574 family)
MSTVQEIENAVRHLTPDELAAFRAWFSEFEAEMSDRQSELNGAEKLHMIEALWDELAATPDAVPVHDWQKSELDRRKANYQKNPASGSSWEDVKKRIRARYGR